MLSMLHSLGLNESMFKSIALMQQQVLSASATSPAPAAQLVSIVPAPAAQAQAVAEEVGAEVPVVAIVLGVGRAGA